MKKVSALALAAVLGVSLTACGGESQPAASSTQLIASATSKAPSSPTPSPTPTPTTAGTLKSADGKLTDTDPKANVIEGAGLRIEIDPAKKFAKAQTFDPTSGEDFKDYFEWDFNEGVFRRFHLGGYSGTMTQYVSDVNTGEFKAVITVDGREINEQIKRMGQWDKSVTDTAAAKDGTEKWFNQRYGKTLKQAAGA